MKEIFQKKVKILHHVKVGPDYFRMGLAFPELARIARPGQFVMVRLSDQRVPLLRRPFSVHNRLVENDEIYGFELLYKVVGQGTQAMSEIEAGNVLDVLGPLGNGFSYPEGIRHAFLVSGGIGVAPLCYLAADLAERRDVRSTVFLGGCSDNDILCQEAFKCVGATICITTEDCSLGESGVITNLVQKAIEGPAKPDVIYACGPHSMLRAVGDIAAAHDVACQVSMETAMACGFGVCLGCAVEKAGEGEGYFHACTDGPVFDSRDIQIPT